MPRATAPWQPRGVALPPLLFAAHLDRAEPWAEVIRRSRQIELLASIDLAASGVEGIEEALDGWPDAAVAVWAEGPREATRIAERLLEHPGPTLLHPAPRRPPLGDGIELTHGWLTLSGVGALERLFGSRGVESVRLRLRGVPDGAADGLTDVLYHAATLALRFGHDVHVERAVLESEQTLTLTLTVDGAPWRVELESVGHGLELTVRTGEGDYGWSADAVSEVLRRPRGEPRAVPIVPWPERAIRQLMAPARGTDLHAARDARALIDAVERSLERRLPPDRFSVGSTADGLAPLGLSGILPPAAPLAPTPPPELPLLEALAYQLDLKPAVFLTVAPQDEARIAAGLPGHVARRERRVQVDAGDRWTDARDRGEPRVELYAARDPRALERLVALQTERPTDAATELGALLGYPACCVQSFARQADRADNSFNRVATAVRTSVGGPWPVLLDDTALKLLPHFPCTYRCERSVQQARDLLAALEDEHPALADAIDAYLGGPVLYFDHDHQLRFHGASTDAQSVRFDAVSIPWSPSEPFAALAGAIARGDRLTLTDGALVVTRGEERVVELRRTDPGLGTLMPFASPG